MMVRLYSDQEIDADDGKNVIRIFCAVFKKPEGNLSEKKVKIIPFFDKSCRDRLL